MKIVEEILKWADTLTDWQSDAIRRIWIHNDLNAQDEDEVYSLLREHVGFESIETKTTIKPARFSKSDIGSATVHGQRVILVSLQELENVNAIPATQQLRFGDHGLTVIYGDNSAGKSGYSRVLKKSCRARGTADCIYPNIYDSKAGANPAKAKFTVKVEDNPTVTIQWQDGQPAPECLGNVAVFDSKTARVYVDDANEVSYIPYGLDVFTKMAALCRSFRAKIQAELDALPKMPDPVARLVGPDLIIKALKVTTTSDDIDKLALFTKNDETRLLELTKAIADYKANDPIKKGQEVRRQKGRIDGLRKQLLSIAVELSTTVVASTEKASREAVGANEAARLASEKAFSGEPLKGTGSIVWRHMFDSARKFSEEEAYSGKSFPVIDEDSLCVLCQQPLGGVAKDRMKRFWQFVGADTAKIAKQKNQILNTITEKCRQLDLGPFDRNPQLYEEIEELSPETAPALKTWLSKQEERRAQIIEAICTNEWGNIAAFEKYPSSHLSKLSKRCEADATKVEKLADAESQKKAEAELAALTYRRAVQENKESMLQWVGRLKTEAKLREALKAIETAQITKKGSALMDEALTQELENALNQEFDGFGVEHLKLKFQRSGSIGSTYHQLQLANAQEGKMNLSDILSEGEHRVVAIASFFAELSTSTHKCGIVFDDPVSSLDHFWRTRVAGRLIEEGRKRQVIVFTHDIVFLLELEKQAKDLKVDMVTQTVFRAERKAGLCSPDLPWLAKPTKARIGYLRQTLQNLEKLHKEKKMDEYSFQVAYFYGLLRETWERAIEEVLLNDSVKRFRQGIETQRLSSVTIAAEDIADIEKGMTKCSTCMPGHDKSPATGSKVIGPKEVHTDLELLENFRSRVEKRRQQK